MIVTTGRLGEQPLSELLGTSYLPILMPNSRAAFLFMNQAHRGCTGILHKSVPETLARSRAHVWIPRGRNLAFKIVQACPTCILAKKTLLSQQIAELKYNNLKICPPWTNISLDFCGPYLVKGVNQRANRKCWVVVYVCQNTKAVCWLAVAGYDTESFLAP